MMETYLKSYYERGVQTLWHVLAHFHTRVLLIEDAVGNGWGTLLEEGGEGRKLLDEHGIRAQTGSIVFHRLEENLVLKEHLVLDLRVCAGASHARSSCAGGGIDLQACITWFRFRV
jgi:hypothetical protein